MAGANHLGRSAAMPVAIAASLRMKNWFHSSPPNGSPIAEPAMKNRTKISARFRVFCARLATSMNRITVTHCEADPMLSTPASSPM